MLRLQWDNSVGAARLVQLEKGGALDVDTSLETPVLLSIFTDLEATLQEIKSAGLDMQQGWWADADSVRDPEVRKRGSKLWLLSRGKTTLATLRRVEQYVKDSLQWMVDKKMVATIHVVASRPRSGIVAIDLVLTRPNKLLPAFKKLWEVRSDVFI